LVVAEAVCPKCGAPVPPGALFCTQCGARLEPGAAGAPPPAPASDARLSVVQVVAIHDREMSSIVQAITQSSAVRVDSLLGSGFAVAPGEFVTDAGLLVGAKEVRLADAAGRTAAARIVAVDPLIGVGLLAADLPGVPPVPARRDQPREGETLTAIGFSSAAGMTPSITVSPGVVSGLHRSGMEIHPVEDYLQSDASLPRGFAGGPAVDATGRLLGMTTAFPLGRSLWLGPAAGIGYFIPADWVERSLAWIRGGQPPRAWMGAHAAAADPDSRKLFGIPGEVRWVVEDVFPDTPAFTRLRRGDGLLRICGEEIPSLAAVQLRLLSAKPGDRCPVEVVRDGKKLTVDLILAPRLDRPRLKGIDALRLYGGVEIGTGSQPGLLVNRVLPNSHAHAARISKGDVLHAVFTKKDLEHPERYDARWRGVKDLPELEQQVARAYSDLDFFAGLKFRCKDGEKREVFIFSLLTATDAF
jgi:S1-C subfamily serine protease